MLMVGVLVVFCIVGFRVSFVVVPNMVGGL